MIHSPDCERCDGSGFVRVWDTEDLADEDNCRCVYFQDVPLDLLCDKCQKVNR